MAEFKEVMKQYNRMCKESSTSSKDNHCPLHTDARSCEVCSDRIVMYFADYEEIIMDWAKEHPVKTNADKFEEVFGFEPFKNDCTIFDIAKPSCESDCDECEFNDFWAKEYKEKSEK